MGQSGEWAGPAPTGAVPTAGASEVMTFGGTVNRALLLVGFLLAGGAWTWFLMHEKGPGAVLPWMIGGLIFGLIAAIVITFKAQWAPVLAPLYAIAEGLALGGISAMFNSVYHGIVIQAAALTVGTLFVMLTLYQTGLVRATEKFKVGVFAATGAVGLFYLVTWVIGMFSPASVSWAFNSGPLSIGISVVIVVIAALNLILDFDFIQQGVEQGAPKYMEWYSGFALLVTLVWLYLEILRLLAKLQDRGR
jgi:uncharacterized YccA/Bax inhibitor family protein